MASTSKRSQEHELAVGFKKVQVTILASEWGSSKGGLSTISRELAIQLANLHEVEITVLLLRCSEEDKKQALLSNVKIAEAKRHPGFDELDWLSFPPEHLQIDVIVGHGVKLGHQAQVIKNSKKCKWVQVVHTDPEELGMFKSYSKPISKGQEKHRVEVELCEMADLVVGIGPKLSEAFRSYLRGCHKDQNVVDFTPGVFDEFKSVKQCPEERKHCSVLVFGRGDDEDFELKGFDIAARAVASLPDFRLVFVGAPDGKHEEIAEKLTGCGVPVESLRVRGFVQSREDLRRLFLEVDLALMPSRTEGFGLTGLEALSAGLPVLVSSNSGFGEALSKVPFGSSFVIDSVDPKVWAAAIKKVWGKDREGRLEEAETLRTFYEGKYSWANQSRDLLGKMISLLNGNSDINTSLQERFAGASPGETSLQDARILKPLKLDDQRRVQEGLTEVEAERQNSAVHQISYEIANCDADIAFFAGRYHKDTRQWLFEDFYKWFSDPGDSRAYVLLGDAGVGKSVMAGALAQRMKKTGRLGAAYFCRHNDGTRNDPRNLLGTIACQLCDCNSEYSSRMGGEDGVKMFLANSSLGVQELCTKLLEEPLSMCSTLQRKLVVIDALDETEYKSREDFICLIKERFLWLPEWLVFFITSRPEDMLQSRLEKYNPCVRICAGNSEQRSLYWEHEQDIQRFLESRVDFSRLPYSAEDVTKLCNGLFLHAFYIAKELNGLLRLGKIGKLSVLLPGDMDDFFQKNLQRVRDKVGADLYSKLLGCIITAPSPLPVSFISFVLCSEMSDLDEQEVIDAVSQFVVMQKTVTFLHNLIHAWLTNKTKAKKLYIDKKCASEYLRGIFKEILSAVVNNVEARPFVTSELRAFVVCFGGRFLCQHGEKDSLKLVFSCLTSYHFLEERIRSGRMGIYYLLKDLHLAASSLGVDEEHEKFILQEISLAIEGDVHVLVESPHLLHSCIRNAADVVLRNVTIPQVSAACLRVEWKVCDNSIHEILSECSCFATASDTNTMAVASGRSLLFVDVSQLQIVGGPFEISQDTIARIVNLEFYSDDKFVFFGRLDKWFSVQRKCVEDFPQFSGNVVHYEWGFIIPYSQYIVVKRNLLPFPLLCTHRCIRELLALWAIREIVECREEIRTCSFDYVLNKTYLNTTKVRIGRQTRRLLKFLGVDLKLRDADETLAPEDPICYYCCRLKELTKANEESCLASVRHLIIELYPVIYRYQVWNLQTGRSLLEDVFQQEVELNSFTYFCHLTTAFDDWKIAMKYSVVDRPVSFCNIAVTAALSGLRLELDPMLYLGRLVTRVDQLSTKLGFPSQLEDYGREVVQWMRRMRFGVLKKKEEQRYRETAQELDELIEMSQNLTREEEIVLNQKLELIPFRSLCPEFPISLLDYLFKSDCLTRFPKGFLNLFDNNNLFAFGLSPGQKWIVTHTSDCFGKKEIEVKEFRGNKVYTIACERFTFTNDDLFLIYTTNSGSLHALSLQKGIVYTSVSGRDLVSLTTKGQFGYLFRRGLEDKAVFLTNIFSPLKFFPRVHVKKPGLDRFIAVNFISSDTLLAASSDSTFTLWKLTEDKMHATFKSVPELYSKSAGAAERPSVTKKCVFSLDGKLIAFQQETRIDLHCASESGGFHCTVFEAECGVTDACVKFSADGSLLLICIQGYLPRPHFYVWDVRKQVMCDSFKSPGLLTVDCFCLSSDADKLVLCGGYYEIEIWEFNKHPCRRLLKTLEVERFYRSVSFSQCTVSLDNELLVCCIGNLIYLYSLSVANVHSSRRILQGHLGKIEFCRFLKVNRYLISYAVDGMVFLWDLTESKAIAFTRIKQGEEKIASMALSPEEDRLVCFFTSDRVCIIELCKLESALSPMTKGKVSTTERTVQPTKRITSTANIPTSSLEDYKSETSTNSDLEEDFYDLPEDYFYESDESD